MTGRAVSGAGLGPFDRGVADLAAADLAGVVTQGLVGELDRSRDLVADQPVGEEAEDLLRGGAGLGLARLIRTDLIIIDDIGLLPVSPDAAEGFYRLVDAAYERHALAVSANLHPSGFDEIMAKTLAIATVDRLLHHAHVVVTQGDSFRLAQATSGQGVRPLH